MTTETPTPRRQCFYIPADQFDEQGYIPSVVTENESGHRPLAGNGSQAQPWHWGHTYDEATRVCAAENLRTFGLTEEDANQIVASSMDAQDDGVPVTGFIDLRPGDLIPDHPLGSYVLAECGHGVAASEWRAGFRVCEHCSGTSADPEWADDENED